MLLLLCYLAVAESERGGNSLLHRGFLGWKGIMVAGRRKGDQGKDRSSLRTTSQSNTKAASAEERVANWQR